MCQQIIELKTELMNKNYDILNLTDDQIEEAAKILLNKFHIYEFPVDIVNVAKKIGLQLLTVKFKNNEDNHIGGVLAISSTLTLQGYKKDKVIKVNKNNSQGHQRFTIIHEIAHFIFDFYFKDELAPYYDCYENNLSSYTSEEHRANRFAAAFLMPQDVFKNEYFYLTNDCGLIDDDEIKMYLAKKFLVSPKAVEKRILNDIII